MIPRLGLCMIVKDEEPMLRECLIRARPYVEQLIIVDTGSKDRTPKIAKEFADHFEEIEWHDDFALARNASLAACKTDWVFYLDADEIMTPQSFDQLSRLLRDAAAETYDLTVRTYCSRSLDPLYREINEWLEELPDRPSSFHGYIDNYSPRVHRRIENLVWEGCVHETFMIAAQRLKLRHSKSSIEIHHFGKIRSADSQARKEKYYRELLQKKLKADEANAISWFELAISFTTTGELERAQLHYEKAIQLNSMWYEPRRNLALLYLRMQKLVKARMLLEESIELGFDEMELRSLLSTAYLFSGAWKEYDRNFVRLKELTAELPASVHRDAAIYAYERKDLAAALEHLKKAKLQLPADEFIPASIQKIENELNKVN